MSRLRSPAALAALAVCSSISCGATQKPRVTAWVGDVAFVDVTVVPMDRDGVLPHHTVLVRGDKIVAVEPTSAVALPPGVTRVDGRGKWLMPGLADMHVHTWDTGELTMFVAAGVTTVRNMFGNEAHLGWRDRIARGELLGPTIVTAGPIVDGDPPTWPGSTVITKPEDADGVVDAHKQAGYDFLKPYGGLQPDVYDALVAAGKQHGVPIAGHVPRGVGLAHALEAKQRSIEHLDGWLSALVPEGVDVTSGGGSFWKTLGRTVENVDEARIPALVQATIQAGTWNCPTIIVWDRFARMDDPEQLAAETRWLDLVPAHVVRQWDPKADFRLRTMDASDFAALRKANALRREIIAALVRAGAPLLVGTDQGNPYVVAGASLHDELELMVAAGVPRPAALRAATAGAAEYLGRRGQFGVVAPGARADLVLVGVDPLASPLPLPPDGVMVRGRWLPAAELGEKLAEVREHAAPTHPSWDGFPPFAPDGTPVLQAGYEILVNGEAAGRERLAVTTVDGKRVTTSQLVLTRSRSRPGRATGSATTGPRSTSNRAAPGRR
jgi:imidazolonepropionase-like amidohydrolase